MSISPWNASRHLSAPYLCPNGKVLLPQLINTHLFMPRTFKFIITLILLAITCLAYGFFIEPKLLKTRLIAVQSPNYNAQTLRVALLSDIHIGGRHVPAKRVETIVARVNALKPDIILIPGDFISGHKARAEHGEGFNAEVHRGLTELGALKAPLGVFASIGNHDVWYDASYVEKTLSDAGLNIVANRTMTLDNSLCISGLLDYDTQGQDPSVFEGCDAGDNIIALMHSPDSFTGLRSDISLAVAGHTHGGQINLPIIGRRVTSTRAGRKWAYGLKEIDGIPAFITAGIGTSILPARFRAPPEIVLIELSGR